MYCGVATPRDFGSIDRLILGGVCRLFPKTYETLAIVRPDTVIRWHRAGFSSYWRWKSRCRSGRPIVPLEIRRLIREVSIANPLWGAPRIHGELLKLGIDVGQTSVAKYMARRRGPPSQGWKTFLRNHADGIVAMDLFVVPTISFRLLYGLLIMGHGRRQILWLGVTAYPTAEWIANQLTEACGWEGLDFLAALLAALFADFFGALAISHPNRCTLNLSAKPESRTERRAGRILPSPRRIASRICPVLIFRQSQP